MYCLYNFCRGNISFNDPPPDQVKDFRLTNFNSSQSEVMFQWTSVGQNGDVGTASNFEIVATCGPNLELEGENKVRP